MKKGHKSSPRHRNTGKRAGASDLRHEYDFSGGVRGKYAPRLRSGGNLVLLDPDVAAKFRSARAVNRALRAYLQTLK